MADDFDAIIDDALSPAPPAAPTAKPEPRATMPSARPAKARPSAAEKTPDHALVQTLLELAGLLQIGGGLLAAALILMMSARPGTAIGVAAAGITSGLLTLGLAAVIDLLSSIDRRLRDR